MSNAQTFPLPPASCAKNRVSRPFPAVPSKAWPPFFRRPSMSWRAKARAGSRGIFGFPVADFRCLSGQCGGRLSQKRGQYKVKWCGCQPCGRKAAMAGVFYFVVTRQTGFRRCRCGRRKHPDTPCLLHWFGRHSVRRFRQAGKRR